MSLPFRALGLGGGGVKGILHIGAILELSKRQKLFFPDGVYGVSVGAVIGTYLAFGLPFDDEGILKLKQQFKLTNFVGNVDFNCISQSFSLKGMLTMDLFETMIVDLFESRGIDIRTKTLGDAIMPLFIISSNLTKGKPTIFSGNVPVLSALKCSCAIPGVFVPQILYNQVYIDGDMFCPSIDKFMPCDSMLCISLKKRMSDTKFTEDNIENMSPLTYIHDIYTMLTQNFHNQVKTGKTLCLHFPGLHSMSDIDEFDIEKILEKASYDLNRFLGTKGVLQELTE
uniref:PNPLA domain-containing protein n=1 Tax=viral metagenome TaxID=1070528 RepID=A0A6C0F6T6_9ZZZZ